MLIDSHCHLDFVEFKEDMPAVLLRAQESGIAVMQTICTRLSRFPEVLALTSGRDNIYVGSCYINTRLCLGNNCVTC